MALNKLDWIGEIGVEVARFVRRSASQLPIRRPGQLPNLPCRNGVSRFGLSHPSQLPYLRSVSWFGCENLRRWKVRNRGYGVYERRVATLVGCDNWLERGSEEVSRCYYGMDRYSALIFLDFCISQRRLRSSRISKR